VRGLTDFTEPIQIISRETDRIITSHKQTVCLLRSVCTSSLERHVVQLEKAGQVNGLIEALFRT
jgi:hypothetical protein